MYQPLQDLQGLVFYIPLAYGSHNGASCASCGLSWPLSRLQVQQRRPLSFSLLIILPTVEADISIPSLNLAIEWNGIVHFKPIYGQTKLDKIQDKDAEKLKIAANKNINLIVIPDLVSNNKILKQAFDDVKVIINKLI